MREPEITRTGIAYKSLKQTYRRALRREDRFEERLTGERKINRHVRLLRIVPQRGVTHAVARSEQGIVAPW